MSTERQGGRSRKRGLSDEDRAVWEGVTRSVKPLRRSAKPAETPSGQERSAEREEKPRAARKASPPPNPPEPAKSAPPSLAPLGRRVRQRVARGNIEIDARLDLHGMTQERAHRRLLSFLRGAQGDGLKLVLVITGKGARAAERQEERGVLKRMVPQWLSLPEFRPLVVGFEEAHIAHGGEGALYVRVRRGR